MKHFDPIGKIGLAPMAGAGDSGFRRICMENGADYSVSEMISSKAIQYGDHKSEQLASHHPDEEPFLIQLFGHEPDCLAGAAAYIQEKYHPIGIDLNMGCPAPKIFNNGDGSALLKNADLAAKIVEKVRGACSCPVSVKMRIGIEKYDQSASEHFAKMVEKAGVSFITVHGRTRNQQYAGKADYQAIRSIKEAVSVPVIANGDVVDGESAERILKETGADGIMIARGALGAPDVFSRIKAYLENREALPLPLKQRFALCLRQLSYMIEDKGEEKACIEFRKHMLWYLKGISGAAVYKARAGKIASLSDCKELIEMILKVNK